MVSIRYISSIDNTKINSHIKTAIQVDMQYVDSIYPVLNFKISLAVYTHKQVMINYAIHPTNRKSDEKGGKLLMLERDRL